LGEDATASKLSAEDKSALQAAVDETISFLEGSDAASKDEIESHQKTLEGVANPMSTSST
jgi:heat shock protein 1/8